MPMVEESVERLEEAGRRGGEYVRAAYRPIAREMNRLRGEIADRAERRAKDARRLARRGKVALDHGIDDVELRIRRNPGAAVAIAFLAGSIATLGMTLFFRRRRH